MRKLLTAACAVLILVPASAQSHNKTSAAERYFANRCSQTQPVHCIHRAALHWEVDFGYMKGIAWRESRYDPYAKNPRSTASGLFQFLTSTFFGSWNPYRGESIWSAKFNSLAAAYAMHRGYHSWWACC